MRDTDTIHVLLVEDDNEDADIFCRYAGQMVSHALSVTRAAEEEEARSLLAKDRFDLVFLDLNLGKGGTGLELLERLRGENLGVPVIVVTGSGDEKKAVEAMKAGAYDYLVKDSLSADLLDRTIRYARRRHSLEQERARFLQKLAELSLTDELTSLANRRSLTQWLEREVERSARSGRSFAALMIDLDHFKEVNDRFGHARGDQVLQQCAATLQGSLRGTDFVARYGGEEFCVILPETGPEGARCAAERLRAQVAALPDPCPTISIGGTVWTDGCKADDVLRRADEALYKAKEAGRDRVVFYGDS